jgi:putative DNA primase/helicase
MTGDVGEQVLVFALGEGANGKSTLITTVQEVAGDYAVQVPGDLLLTKKHDSHPTELTTLHGRRLAICSEIEKGRRLAEVQVKQLTGGDRITARRMREDFWQFDPSHKLIIVANHKPTVRGQDHAIWRRIRLVPFSVTIPEEQRDPDLPAKLLAEGPGILRWLVDGCLEWQRIGLAAPAAVTEATNSYRREEDQVAAFIDERCIVADTEMVAKGKLYAAYIEWAKTGGENPLTKRAFGEELIKREFADEQIGKAKTRCWLGISLRDQGGEA